MATPTKKPKGAVTSLAVTRTKNTHTMHAAWKVPSSLTKDSSADHATQLIVTWVLGLPGKDPKSVRVLNRATKKESNANLNSLTIGRTTYTRSSFWPLSDKKLTYVTCTVQASNRVGKSSKKVSQTAKFKPPRIPSIAEIAFDEATAKVTTTITTDAGIDLQERYDTEYWWEVYDSATDAMVVADHSTSTATTIDLEYNASDYVLLGDGYRRITCYAVARGYAGDSKPTPTETFYLAYPNKPVINSVSAPSSASSDRVYALIDTNETTEHPVTQVQLQVLQDVPYATPAEVAQATEQWEDIGGVDDGDCTALTALVEDVRPETPGRHSWLRVKSWYLVEETLASYSAPMEVTDLFQPAYQATGDVVRLISGRPGDDGESALVTMAWAPAGHIDQSDGTELSWSDQIDTWRSTDEPNVFNVLYDDGPISYTDPITGTTTSYQSSATITIKGLDEGAVTYVKARRYSDNDDGVSYGEYSNTLTVTPAIVPTSVVLKADAYVSDGEGVPVQWTFDGTSPQDAWQIITTDGTTLAEDANAIGSTIIPADRIAAFAVNGEIEFYVSVSTGGQWVDSNAQTVHVTNRPTLTASTAETLTAQPMQIAAQSDSATAELTIIVTSNGTSGDTPTGVRTQATGDVVWSGVVSPEWSSGAATVTLPDGLDFVDGATYTATVRATDPGSGLSSGVETVETVVDWSHQAPDPDGCATLTPIDAIDADGISTKAVQIVMTTPTGAALTDVFDVYRVTNDGAQLIGQSLPLTASVVDDFAPFGTGMEHRYRIACRTVDGDVAWSDFPYTLAGDALRIDWADRYVELPYDLAIDDGYEKDVDVHAYLDGSVDAFFNQGIARTAKLSTDVMRLVDPDTIEAVHALAHYIGSAFVRTPTGAAYEAAVTVDSIAPTHELAAVSITAAEVNLTADYMLPPYDVEDETEEESEG